MKTTKEGITYSSSGKLLNTNSSGDPTFELNKGDYIDIQYDYGDITGINLKIN